MFIEIALGVVLGGVILYLLYLFWEEAGEAICEFIGAMVTLLLLVGGGIGVFLIVREIWENYWG